MIHFTDDLIKFMIQKMVKQLYISEYAIAPPTTTAAGAAGGAAATGGGAGGGNGMYANHDMEPAVLAFVQAAVGNAWKAEKNTGAPSSSSSSSNPPGTGTGVGGGTPSAIWVTLAQAIAPLHHFLGLEDTSGHISPLDAYLTRSGNYQSNLPVKFLSQISQSNNNFFLAPLPPSPHTHTSLYILFLKDEDQQRALQEYTTKTLTAQRLITGHRYTVLCLLYSYPPHPAQRISKPSSKPSFTFALNLPITLALHYLNPSLPCLCLCLHQWSGRIAWSLDASQTPHLRYRG